MERVKEGIPVELIIPLLVAEELKQSPYAEKLAALKSYKNFKLKFTNEDTKMGLIVTDKCLALSLYKKRGTEYDITTGLFSYDPQAIEWGGTLFDHVRFAQKRIYMAIMPYDEFFQIKHT